MTPNVPESYMARSAQREDAEAVLAIIQARTLALTGEIDFALADLLEEWDDPISIWSAIRASCLRPMAA